MSSSERAGHRPANRRWRAIVAVAGLLAVTACTVQPLYSVATPSATPVTGSIAGDLSSIAIKPVSNRVGQEVRNNLIFLFNGGKGQPAESRYTLELTVSALSEATTTIQINKLDEPTSAILTAIASYRLKDAAGKHFGSGRRQFASSYDVPRQEFAAVRARRDAENRAARELAELVRLAVAQDLARGPQPPEKPRGRQQSLF